MEKKRLRTLALVVLLGMGSVVGSAGAAFADDADTHKFWEDQQTPTSTQNPSSRVPDSGRATYQNDEGQTTVAPAPTGHRVRHQRHRSQS